MVPGASIYNVERTVVDEDRWDDVMEKCACGLEKTRVRYFEANRNTELRFQATSISVTSIHFAHVRDAITFLHIIPSSILPSPRRRLRFSCRIADLLSS
jgi:hypothetical protein